MAPVIVSITATTTAVAIAAQCHQQQQLSQQILAVAFLEATAAITPIVIYSRFFKIHFDSLLSCLY
jgi:hypothetical protein